MKTKTIITALAMILFTYQCANSGASNGSQATTNSGSVAGSPQTNPDSTGGTPATDPGTTTGTNPGTTTDSPVPIVERNLYVVVDEISGQVGFYLNGTTLEVTGKLHGNYNVESVNLWADNDFATLPLNRAYNAKSGQFPYQYLAAGPGETSFTLPVDINNFTQPVDPYSFCSVPLYVAIQINISVSNPDGTVTFYSLWTADYSFRPDSQPAGFNEQGWFSFSLPCI